MANRLNSDGSIYGSDLYEYAFFDTCPKYSFFSGQNGLYKEGWRLIEERKVNCKYETWTEYGYWERDEEGSEKFISYSEGSQSREVSRLISCDTIYYCKRLKG